MTKGARMKPEVDDWLSELTDPQREIAADLRALIHEEAPALREEFKWGQPCYYGRAMVCHLQKARGHVSIGFRQGALMDDPGGLLDGTGREMRHVKIRLGALPDRETLSRFLLQAVALDQST